MSECPSSSRCPSSSHSAPLLAVVAALVVALVVVLAPPRLHACWRPPVPAPVADPFRAPPCRWCPGNRGIEYATSSGTVVRSVASGVVTFAGRVASTDYVVVELPDGRRITYGHVRAAGLRRGDVVVRGARIGRTTGNLHFGVRLGDEYVDPERWLGELVGRARLIPATGRASRPAPPPILRCRA